MRTAEQRMSMTEAQHSIVEAWDLVLEDQSRLFMVSRTSLTLLQTLGPGSIWSYQELSETTGIPLNSLYVFCSRLEKVGLIRRAFVGSGDPKRTRTEISLSPYWRLQFRGSPVIVR